MGLKDDILNANDVVIEPVEIPEWPGEQFVRVMTGTERDRYELLATNGSEKMIRGMLAAFTLCDAEGTRLFADSDAKALSEKSSTALDRVFAKAARVNRMRDIDLEELMGNSSAVPSVALG